MKKYIGILILAALSFTACTTPQGATSRVYSDDVYYSSKDVAADAEKQKQKDIEKATEARQEAENQKAAAKNNKQASSTTESDEYYQTTEKRTDSEGNTYVTNNYYDEPFNYDDYYDYEYATRIRRFHNNVPTYSYYDDYYTNSYWYSADPYTYGTSVYMGYNFWGPSYAIYTYNPQFYWYTSCGWGYDPWYHPYGFNPYMNGYANGYNNGYWDGYYSNYYHHAPQNNYFNSYDNNSYYGARGTMTANSRTTAQPSMAHRYMETVEKETHKPFEATHGRDNNEYMKPTTVNDYMSKPARGDNNTTKPMIPDNSRPSNSGKPVYNERPASNPSNERPVHNNSDRPDQSRPTDRPIINESKPVERPVERPAQRPTYEQKPVEKPVKERPNYEKPRESTQQYQAPAPRNNSSSGNNRSSSPASGSTPPRRR